MKNIDRYLLAIAVLVLLIVVFFSNLNKREACSLVGTAFSESDELAPGWYSQAGIVLEGCGVKRARVLGEHKACLLNKNSYPDTDCTAEIKAYDKLFEEDR